MSNGDRLWLFETDSSWSAEVPGRPRGDSTARWCQEAVPRLIASGKGRAPTPAVVVAHVEATGPCAPKGRAKALLDALHDGRRSGPWYGALGAVAPLPGDEPRFVTGLAVEVRPAGAAERVRYGIGRELRVRGDAMAVVDVPIAAPNDIAGDPGESARIAIARRAFVEALAAAWGGRSIGLPASSEVGVVVRHRPGRDEDNTWDTWISAVAATSAWSRDAWRGDGPLSNMTICSIASVSDPGLACQVRYEIYRAAHPSTRGGEHSLVTPRSAPRGQLAAAGGQVKQVGALEELVTLENFRNALARGGVIVITDTASPTKAHRPSCPHVTSARFTQKVVTGNRKNGRYFWAPTLGAAQAGRAARPCSVCSPS